MNTRKKAQKGAATDDKPTDQPARHYDPTSEEIRVRAYGIYIQRGRTDGLDLEDWLQVENELKASSRRRPRD